MKLEIYSYLPVMKQGYGKFSSDIQKYYRLGSWIQAYNKEYSRKFEGFGRSSNVELVTRIEKRGPGDSFRSSR